MDIENHYLYIAFILQKVIVGRTLPLSTSIALVCMFLNIEILKKLFWGYFLPQF